MSHEQDPGPVALHEEYLVARVREIVRERPDVRFVGLVLNADAPELESILLSKAEINRAEDGSVSLILTRDSAKQMLAAWSPKLLDWIENQTPGVIPVIQSARKGMRTGTIAYDAAY